MVTAPSLSSPLKIGEVARRSGLTVKTIRFYCDEGLIQPISRSEGGYLRTLRAMEIPLTDVGQILAARRSGVCTCSEVPVLSNTSRRTAAEERCLMISFVSAVVIVLRVLRRLPRPDAKGTATCLLTLR